MLNDKNDSTQLLLTTFHFSSSAVHFLNIIVHRKTSTRLNEIGSGLYELRETFAGVGRRLDM